MIPLARQPDRTAGWTFSLSLLIHLVILFIFTNADLFRTALHESTPYYVDIVSLPDPAPARSEPVSAPATALPLPAARPQAPALKPAMALPAKQLSPAPATSAATADQERRDQEAREFSEKMSRLERDSGARHQAEALATLQKKAAEKRAAGATPAAGIGKGADYGAYIQSRLKDALSSNIVYRSKNPEAAVHLYIDKSGKLTKYVMTRPSSDKLFNSSVIRTIESAKADFPPVPSGASFDKLYVFSPQEVKK